MLINTYKRASLSETKRDAWPVTSEADEALLKYGRISAGGFHALLQNIPNTYKQLHTFGKCGHSVYRSLSGLAPGYLADDCQLVTDARARLLRSADMNTLSVHRTPRCFGDRIFAAAATRVWNSLPSDLREAELSYSRFMRSLKTFYLDSPTTAHCELLFHFFRI